MLFRHRLFLAITLGLAIGLVNLYLKSALGLPNDFAIAHCGAQKLVGGLNPYTCPTNGMPSNPLTTIIALVPLAWMPADIASAVIVGISSGLLAYALNRENESWRLLAFLSVPFIYSVQISQWAPLFLAATYFGWLYPFVLVKPHLGLSVAVMKFTPKRFALTAILGLCTLLVMPGWVAQWLQQARNYGGFIPLLTVPGVALLLALLRWRGDPARWLLLLSVTPQRAWYDQLLLWTVPTSRTQTIVLTACSWIMFLPYIILGARILGEFSSAWWVISLYYPALAMVLLNRDGTPASMADGCGFRARRA